MKKHLLVIQLLLAIAAPMSVRAEPAWWRPVDALQLEVAGVKLGMGYDQALEALATHFQLSQKERADLKAATLTSYGPITKKNQPVSVGFTKDGNTVVLNFVERVPDGQGDSVAVFRVSLSIPNASGNAAAMKQAAIAKYGEPSDPRRKAVFHWCAHYNQITACDPLKPKLSLVAGSLSLSDPTMERAAREYLNSHMATTPRL